MMGFSTRFTLGPHIAVPTEIHIGTRDFFQRGEQYIYHWEPSLDGFLCDNPTDVGLPGENLLITRKEDYDQGGNWWVAMEGVWQEDSHFHCRRGAFRTQEEFWIAGWHDWQVNRCTDDGEDDWNRLDPSILRAQTRVPPGTINVTLTELLQTPPS